MTAPDPLGQRELALAGVRAAVAALGHVLGLPADVSSRIAIVGARQIQEQFNLALIDVSTPACEVTEAPRP